MRIQSTAQVRTLHDRIVTLNEAHYRPGTEAETLPVRFAFSGGGIGDYINWVPALQWIAEQCPQVRGHLFAPAFFYELAQHFFLRYPGWRVSLIDDINKDRRSACIGPDIHGRVQLANALSSHLLDLGFLYFANMSPVPPAYDRLPDLTDLPDMELPDSLRPGSYVVLTPGGTTAPRTVPGAHWNPLLRWLKERGLTPVLLGKADLTATHKAQFPDGMDMTGVCDLRERTSLLEAAYIMSRAAAVAGLDNGLLHLAACTDTRLLFAYNIASPEHRRPRRGGRGRYAELYLTREELPCTGCQSNMKVLYQHDFKSCLYRDNLCIELLFEDGARRWIAALETLLEAP